MPTRSRETTTTSCVLAIGLASFAGAGAGAGGCGDGDLGKEGGGAPTPGVVTLLGELRPSELCQMPEVERITVEATRIGCEPGPPAPCTLPAEPEVVEGDIATCPVSDPVRLMGVEVDEVGRWQVRAVGRFTTGETVDRCFTGPDGTTEIVVTQADLDAGATLDLKATDAPCG